MTQNQPSEAMALALYDRLASKMLSRNYAAKMIIEAFDCFAAQRVTAAESEIETRFWSIVDQDAIQPLPSDMWNALSRLVMRAAAADKARREATDRTRLLEVALENLFAMVQGEVPSLLRNHHLFDQITRALTPQNPGDAATESER